MLKSDLKEELITASMEINGDVVISHRNVEQLRDMVGECNWESPFHLTTTLKLVFFSFYIYG